MKIDIFPHLFPRPFHERMLILSERASYMQERVLEIPVMIDLEMRLRRSNAVWL